MRPRAVKKRQIADDDESYDAKDKGDASDYTSSSESSKPHKKKPKSFFSGDKKAPVVDKTPPPKKAVKNSQLSTASGTSDAKRVSDVSQSVLMNEEPSFVDQEDQVIGGGFTSVDDIKEARPYFIKEEIIRDFEGRTPDQPTYDPTTLHIPEKEWKNFTPAMRQYWEIK